MCLRMCCRSHRTTISFTFTAFAYLFIKLFHSLVSLLSAMTLAFTFYPENLHVTSCGWYSGCTTTRSQVGFLNWTRSVTLNRLFTTRQVKEVFRPQPTTGSVNNLPFGSKLVPSGRQNLFAVFQVLQIFGHHFYCSTSHVYVNDIEQRALHWFKTKPSIPLAAYCRRRMCGSGAMWWHPKANTL